MLRATEDSGAEDGAAIQKLYHGRAAQQTRREGGRAGHPSGTSLSLRKALALPIPAATRAARCCRTRIPFRKLSDSTRGSSAEPNPRQLRAPLRNLEVVSPP